VSELVDPHKNKEPGKLLYVDNFYTFIELIEILQPLGFQSTSTIKKNRKGLPKATMEEKLEVGSRLLTKNDINLLMLKDKKKVIVLSNVYGGQMINKRQYDGTKWFNIPGPFAIKEYNLRTHGVGRANQNVHTINITANKMVQESILLPYGSLSQKCANPS